MNNLGFINGKEEVLPENVDREVPDLLKSRRLTPLSVNNEAENEEPQPQKKRGRLTTLNVINEAKNGNLIPVNIFRKTKKNILYGGFQK